MDLPATSENSNQTPRQQNFKTCAVSAPLKIGGHGSTYGGNPVACAAGLATWNVVEEEGLVQHASELGARFKGMLESLQGQCDEVVSVRGRGLMVGLVLNGEARPVFERARSNGLLVTLAGPNVLRILPPLVATDDHCEQATKILKQVLKA